MLGLFLRNSFGILADLQRVFTANVTEWCEHVMTVNGVKSLNKMFEKETLLEAKNHRMINAKYLGF